MHVAHARRLAVPVALVAGLLVPAAGASAAGWTPTQSVSGDESVTDIAVGAGPAGTAALAWSDGVTARIAVKPPGSGSFGVPVILGPGTEVDLDVTEEDAVVVGWTDGMAVRVAERAAAATGFAELPGVPTPCTGLQLAVSALGRLVVKTTCTHSFDVNSGPLGGPLLGYGGFGSSPDLTSTDMVLSAGGGAAWAGMTARGASSTSARLGRVQVPGGPDLNAVFETLTDSGGGFSTFTTSTSTGARVADAAGVPVMTWVTATRQSILGIPTGGTTALRTYVDPDAGAPVLSTLDTAPAGDFGLGAVPGPAALERRGGGALTAAWSVSGPVGGAAVRTASLGSGATAFDAPVTVPGLIPAPPERSAPDLETLPGDSLVLAVAGADSVAVASAPASHGFGSPTVLAGGVQEPGPVVLRGDGAGGLLAVWPQGPAGARRAQARLYDDEPPTLSTVDMPGQLTGGQTGTFSAQASDRWSGAQAEWDFGDGTATVAGSPVTHRYAADGVYAARALARDGGGNASEFVERVVRVTGTPGPAPGAGPGATHGAGSADTTPPVISGLALSRSRFAVAAKNRAVVRRGTAVRFRLSEAANVTLTVTRGVRGYRRGKSCSVVRPRGVRKPRRCTVVRPVGTLAADGAVGANSVPFKGRVGGRALRPGTYRLALVASDSSGNRSREAATTFTIAH